MLTAVVKRWWARVQFHYCASRNMYGRSSVLIGAYDVSSAIVQVAAVSKITFV